MNLRILAVLSIRMVIQGPGPYHSNQLQYEILHVCIDRAWEASYMGNITDRFVARTSFTEYAKLRHSAILSLKYRVVDRRIKSFKCLTALLCFGSQVSKVTCLFQALKGQKCPCLQRVRPKFVNSLIKVFIVTSFENNEITRAKRMYTSYIVVIKHLFCFLFSFWGCFVSLSI